MPGGYVVRDANGQALVYVYSRDNEAVALQAKVLTKDEARRIRHDQGPARPPFRGLGSDPRGPRQCSPATREEARRRTCCHREADRRGHTAAGDTAEPAELVARLPCSRAVAIEGQTRSPSSRLPRRGWRGTGSS
jgi:hypothetical protein